MNVVIVCLYGCYSYNSTNQYAFALCSVQKPTSQSFHEIQRLVKNGQLDCDNPSWSPRKTGINPRTNQGWTPGFGWPFTSRNSVDCPTKSRWGVGGLHLSWEYNKGYITTYVGIFHHCYTQISMFVGYTIPPIFPGRPCHSSGSSRRIPIVVLTHKTFVEISQFWFTQPFLSPPNLGCLSY